VPGEVPYDEFWMRYFFKIAEVEREEETRKRLMSGKSMG
jgi:hypothetical protein